MARHGNRARRNEDAAFAASQHAPGAHGGELGDISTTPTFTAHANPACLDSGACFKVQAGLRCCDSPDLAMVWPRKMQELRHIKRQQELGNGQKDP